MDDPQMNKFSKVPKKTQLLDNSLEIKHENRILIYSIKEINFGS